MEQDTSTLPVFDLSPFLENDGQELSTEVLQACRQLSDCLSNSGALVIRDPRVTAEDNEHFLDLMERYYEQPDAAKLADTRPEVSYQVGATPPLTEVPRSLVDPECKEAISQQPEQHRATMPTNPDVKWRYMWRVGPRPESTEFPELNAAPVLPQAFPEWAAVLDSWGAKMLAAVEAVAEMAAVGLGLERGAFRNRMAQAPHLLAPTGANLEEHTGLGTVLAGYHYDLNFLTIHGRSRYPGLHIWLRDGRRLPVRIPEGCLLLQAGKQIEWLTAGHVKAGMHEVIVTEQTLATAHAARASGRSLWRVSSTVFSHIASDQLLQPLGRFAEAPGGGAQYPAQLAGAQVQDELAVLNIGAGRVPRLPS